eukprot:5495847-Amphidinium_carterae.1
MAQLLGARRNAAKHNFEEHGFKPSPYVSKSHSLTHESTRTMLSVLSIRDAKTLPGSRPVHNRRQPLRTDTMSWTGRQDKNT